MDLGWIIGVAIAIDLQSVCPVGELRYGVFGLSRVGIMF